MNDPNRIFASGGAIEAALEAKKAGKLRYIGFTGHKRPQIHLHMLQIADRYGFTFDTVQMPLHVMDAHFDSFEQMVLPELEKRPIGALAMKPLSTATFLHLGVFTPLASLHYPTNRPPRVVTT